MEDVEREQPIVDARTVHAQNPLVRARQLGREHSRFTQHNHSAAANGNRKALRAAGR